MSQSADDLSQKRDELIFDLIKKRVDNELERAHNLDSKAGNLIGFISVVIGLLLGAGTFKLSILLPTPILSSLYFIGIGILLVSTGFALGAFKVRSWIIVPNVQTLINKYTNVSYGEVLQRNAGEMSKAVRDSEKQNDNKAKLIEWSWYFLISGLSMVFIFVIVYTAVGAHS